ncbi:MAG: ATP-binding protein [Chloroflexota bacterium]
MLNRYTCAMHASPPYGDSGEQDAPTFGALLIARRNELRMSQEELASAAGLSVQTISELERERRATPQAASISLLARALSLEGPALDLFVAAGRQRRRLRARDLPDAVSAGPARGAPAAPASDPGAILGRAADIDVISACLAAGERLLTLRGPGGVGKTRLARAIGDRVATGGRPVLVVPLDAVTSPDLVLPAIARAAGVADQPTLERIAGAIPPGALLLLDNFEQVVASAPDIAALLHAAPSVAILVTSREALRVSDERIIPVDPLPVPDPGDDAGLLSANPGVALFMRALAAAAASRTVDAADLAAAAAIVRLVDGLPLAIELAAGQGATLPVATIAALLDTAGLAALARGRRDAPARFQTMDAAIAWSADLLPPDARRLFRLLGAFRGGFTTEALLAVTAASGEPRLIAALPALAESQLVQPDPAYPGTRLRMLEPIRMFALARLREAGEESAARRAHAAHYLRWAQARAAEVDGPDPMPALDALDADLANIQTAIDATESLGAAGVADALRAAASNLYYWEVRCRFREGRAALAAAIAAADAIEAAAPGAMRGTALLDGVFVAGYLAYLQTDAPELERVLARLRPLAAAEGSAEYAARVALLDVWLGDLDRTPATDLLPAARAAHALVADGPRETSWHLSLLTTANLLVEVGELDAALPMFDDYTRWALNRQFAIAKCAANTWGGHLLFRLGRHEEARQRLVESLDGSRAGSAMTTLAWSVLGIAAAIAGPEASREDLERSARLLGAFDAELAANHLGSTTKQEALLVDTRARIASALGPERLAALLAEGRALPADAVLALARA